MTWLLLEVRGWAVVTVAVRYGITQKFSSACLGEAAGTARLPGRRNLGHTGGVARLRHLQRPPLKGTLCLYGPARWSYPQAPPVLWRRDAPDTAALRPWILARLRTDETPSEVGVKGPIRVYPGDVFRPQRSQGTVVAVFQGHGPLHAAGGPIRVYSAQSFDHRP